MLAFGQADSPMWSTVALIQGSRGQEITAQTGGSGSVVGIRRMQSSKRGSGCPNSIRWRDGDAENRRIRWSRWKRVQATSVGGQ